MVEWKTRYAKAGDINIAYQSAGDGPLNLVVAPAIVSHVEYFHEVPGYTQWLERLAAFARVAVYDKHGQGMSDRPDRVTLLEERVDDVVAVMDACAMADAAIVGVSEGGAATILSRRCTPTAPLPSCCAATSATYLGDPLEGAFMDAAVGRQMLPSFVETWGEGLFGTYLAPSLLNTAHERLLGRLERFGSTKGAIAEVFDMLAKVDVPSGPGEHRARPRW